MAEKKILVIDDNSDTVASVEMILRHQGYLVSTATSGLYGLKKAVELRPDIIILDLMMKDMNGWEFLRRKLGEPVIAPLPVIVMTGYPDVPEPLVGKVSVLVKPAVPDILLAKIKEVLQKEEASV